jgi:YD repeat-containing protein
MTLGNVMSKAVYDYGTGAHGALLSNTQYTYLHQSNSAYVTANILDRMTQASVYNSLTASSSTLVSQTTTAYDAFSESIQSGLKSTTGTTQHDYTNYSTVNAVRGLPTSVTKYVGPSSSSTISYTDYNDLGAPTISADPKGNRTTYTYDTANQNAFLTVKTLPPTGSIVHLLKTSYDPHTGLLMNQTDQNGNVTSFTYDPRMRQLTAVRPDGGSTTTSYPDPNHVIAITTESSTRSITNTTVLDGLGRKITASTSSDPVCQTLSVDTSYDLMGRVQTASNPHCVSSNDTNGLTTYSRTYRNPREGLSRLVFS